MEFVPMNHGAGTNHLPHAAGLRAVSCAAMGDSTGPGMIRNAKRACGVPFPRSSYVRSMRLNPLTLCSVAVSFCALCIQRSVGLSPAAADP